jgi:hypothetical protein
VLKDEEMRSKLKFVMLVTAACSLSVLSSCTTTRVSTQVTEAADPQNQQPLRTGMYEDRSTANPSRVLVGRGLNDEGNVTVSLSFVTEKPPTVCAETRSLEPFETFQCADGSESRFEMTRVVSDGSRFELSGSGRTAGSPAGSYELTHENPQYHLPLVNDRPTPMFADPSLKTAANEVPASTPMLQLDAQSSTDQTGALPRPLHPKVAWFTEDGAEQTGWIDMESFVRGQWIDQSSSTPLFTFRAAIDVVDGFTIVNAIEVVDRKTGNRHQLLFSGARSKRDPRDAIAVSDAAEPGVFHLQTFVRDDRYGDADIQVGNFLFDPDTTFFADYAQP